MHASIQRKGILVSFIASESWFGGEELSRVESAVASNDSKVGCDFGNLPAVPLSEMTDSTKD